MDTQEIFTDTDELSQRAHYSQAFLPPLSRHDIMTSMLRNQRLLAFSSRVHTYLLLLLCFFLLAYFACSYAEVPSEYLQLLLLLENIFSWAIYIFGVWLIVLCFLNLFQSKLFPLNFFLLSLLRIGCAFFISYLFSVVEHLVGKGLTIGF